MSSRIQNSRQLDQAQPRVAGFQSRDSQADAGELRGLAQVGEIARDEVSHGDLDAVCDAGKFGRNLTLSSPAEIAVMASDNLAEFTRRLGFRDFVFHPFRTLWVVWARWQLRRAEAKFLAIALLSCVLTGLSLACIRTASVSAFFCVQKSVTPSLSGAGVADGNETPAQVGNTVAGIQARENPGTGLWCYSQKLVSMSAKKSKGAARPKATAVPARRLFLTDTTREAVARARVVYKLETWHEAARTLLSFAAGAGTLTPDCGPEYEPRLPAGRGTSADLGEHRPLRPFKLGARLDREFSALAESYGLPLSAAAAIALDWMAPRGIAITLASREDDAAGNWPDPDDDDAGEEWKKGGAS